MLKGRLINVLTISQLLMAAINQVMLKMKKEYGSGKVTKANMSGQDQ